jgi:hypothetical protein
MNQKVKQQRFLIYLWLLNILKKLTYGHLLGPGSGSGSGSGPRRPDPDPDPTKKVRIRPDPDPDPQHWTEDTPQNSRSGGNTHLSDESPCHAEFKSVGIFKIYSNVSDILSNP